MRPYDLRHAPKRTRAGRDGTTRNRPLRRAVARRSVIPPELCLGTNARLFDTVDMRWTASTPRASRDGADERADRGADPHSDQAPDHDACRGACGGGPPPGRPPATQGREGK